LYPEPFPEPIFIQFSTNNPCYLPVTSPELLALHTICCKVAYISGTAKYLNKVYQDAEYIGILALDSTSTDILKRINWYSGIVCLGFD